MANPLMMRAFVETEGRKGVRVERAHRRERKKRKPIKTQSHKQEVRTAFLNGQKAARIADALTLVGTIGCAHCPTSFQTFDEAWAGLDLHHGGTKRSQGQGYSGGKKFGSDDPRATELVCRPCHKQLESNPEWSAA